MNAQEPPYPRDPITLRVQPSPWESLASVLSRASRRMGYEKPEWLLQPENSSYRLQEQTLSWLCRKEDFLYLEYLLRLDEETLYLTTLHRFASVFQQSTDTPSKKMGKLISRPLLSRNSNFQGTSYTSVCPACLSQSKGFDRLYWQIALVLLCPIHLLPLRTSCPQCNRGIPALRTELFQCPFCKGGDYRQPMPFKIENRVLLQGEQLMLQALGIPVPQINTLTEDYSASPLLYLCPADYFHLYTAMVEALSRLFWPEDIPTLCLKLRVLTQKEITTQSLWSTHSQAPEILLFHALFDRWPHNFFLFLDIAYRAFILGHYYDEIQSSFHTLFEEALSRDVFAHIRHAYRDYREIVSARETD